MAREAKEICWRLLKESNKSRFDSYSVRNSVLVISHITFWDCRVLIFSGNLFSKYLYSTPFSPTIAMNKEPFTHRVDDGVVLGGETVESILILAALGLKGL